MSIYLRALVLIILTLLTWAITVQSPAMAQGHSLTRATLLMKSEQRLQAISEVERIVKSNPDLAGLATQYLPFVSDYSVAHPYENTTPAKSQNPDYVANLERNIDGLKQMSAIEEIARLCENYQIVILNEAHDMPQHRAFALRLALQLRKSGFNYLGIEALSHKRGRAGEISLEYPTVMTGHYVGCPIFGDFVRQTSKAGFKLIAYEIESRQQTPDLEDLTDRILERERAQCENLLRTVFDQDPKAKLFLYVGYSHATENWQTEPDGREVGWLAAQLKKKTGIDPLTIDQVGGSFNPNSKTIDPVFPKLNQRFDLSSPSIFKTTGDKYVSSDGYHGKTDLTVFHPPHTLVDGRPNWLSMNGYRQPLVIENSECYDSEPVLIQAFLESEQPYGLPVDQVLVEQSTGRSRLLLPKSRYVLKRQTVQETTVWKNGVIVN